MRRFAILNFLIRAPFMGMLAFLSMVSLSPGCSAPYFMVMAEGWSGWAAMVVTTLLCLSLIVDLLLEVVNLGWQPLRMIAKYRWFLFLIGSLCVVMPAFTFSRFSVMSIPTFFFYAMIVVWGMALASWDSYCKRGRNKELIVWLA